ncbi:MAG: hypothetical protein MR568_21080 [Eisenbergiella massiliensis]|nr:sigma factor-like helix-turn-helix DNA-binding protein [Eisenbergiella massiliensis]MCI6709388.1 hypothetical protein [Eisenbergiella massiliensis]
MLEAIRTLPEEKRTAILLYYFEGMTDVEIRCSIRRAARYSTDGQALLNC